MPKPNAKNTIILDGYMAIVDIPRGIKVEKATGEYSMMVFEQDSIIKKYSLKISDFN